MLWGVWRVRRAPRKRFRILRAAVLQWIRIPVSVGIVPTKTLAKVANHAAKKDEKQGEAPLLLDEAAQDIDAGLAVWRDGYR